MLALPLRELGWQECSMNNGIRPFMRTCRAAWACTSSKDMLGPLCHRWRRESRHWVGISRDSSVRVRVGQQSRANPIRDDALADRNGEWCREQVRVKGGHDLFWRQVDVSCEFNGVTESIREDVRTSGWSLLSEEWLIIWCRLMCLLACDVHVLNATWWSMKHGEGQTECSYRWTERGEGCSRVG